VSRGQDDAPDDDTALDCHLESRGKDDDPDYDTALDCHKGIGYPWRFEHK